MLPRIRPRKIFTDVHFTFGDSLTLENDDPQVFKTKIHDSF